MIVKKSHGQIFGAHFNKNEQKAFDIELGKALADYTRKNANEVDAIFLCYLNLKYGWAYKKLKDAYFGIVPEIEKLAERYEMTGNGDRVWLATHHLKEIGIDIEEWRKELDKELGETL